MLIWVLVMIALLSSILIFGLGSLGQLESMVTLEQYHQDHKQILEQTVQEQWLSLKEHCSEWPGEQTIRLIGFAPNSALLGEKNGRYFYEVSLDATSNETGWMVVTTPTPLLDLYHSEGPLLCPY